MINRIRKPLALFSAGGTIYVLVEIFWRGHSHYSMFVVGGLCFLLIGAINNYFSWELGFVWQTLIGTAIVTIVEFLSGMLLNVWLGLGIWDYSQMPCNLYGQICLTFVLAWIPLVSIAIYLDDFIRWKLFGEESPHYTLF